jgi:hypothetical protein
MILLADHRIELSFFSCACDLPIKSALSAHGKSQNYNLAKPATFPISKTVYASKLRINPKNKKTLT